MPLRIDPTSAHGPYTAAELECMRDLSPAKSLAQAPAGTAPPIDRSIIHGLIDSAPHVLDSPSLSSGAVLVCPHCDQPLHMQLSPLLLHFGTDTPSSEPDDAA